MKSGGCEAKTICRKHHWTVYIVLLLVLLSIVAIIRQAMVMRRSHILTRAVTEAGGYIVTGKSPLPWTLGKRTIEDAWFARGKPVEACIESGSHPIPDELVLIAGLPSIRRLSLTTNQVGDYLVPVISTFQEIEYLNLQGTDISAESVLLILEAIPNLKELHLSTDRFSDAERKNLRTKFPSKIQFTDLEAGEP
jgi:hypothetical protein